VVGAHEALAGDGRLISESVRCISSPALDSQPAPLKLRLTERADLIILPVKIDRDIRRMAKDFMLTPIEKFGNEEKEKLLRADNPS